MVDGTTNVLLFGEVMGGDATTLHSFAWASCGVMVTRWGLAPIPPTPGAQPETTWSQFTSRHPNTVQFCMGDASVHPFSLNIDNTVFQKLGAVADGAIVEVP
jgi:hypothetical protein